MLSKLNRRPVLKASVNAFCLVLVIGYNLSHYMCPIKMYSSIYQLCWAYSNWETSKIVGRLAFMMVLRLVMRQLLLAAKPLLHYGHTDASINGSIFHNTV